MRIAIDHDASLPAYRQVERAIARSIRLGTLPPGERLPSTRALAAELGVARITVVTAYAELDAAGLIETRTGSGTFVAAHPPPARPTRDVHEPVWPVWHGETPAPGSGRPSPPSSSPSRRRAGTISFTGVGDPRRFPVRALASTVREVLALDGADALGYGDLGAGHRPLRETVAQLLAVQGIHATADQVMITSGSQQALAIVCETLLRPGDAVLVEDPGYDHALGLFRAMGLRPIGAPVDRHGMVVDAVDDLVRRHGIRLIATIPDFQNPTGTCLALARRRALLGIAAHHGIPLVEDDYVGDLRYEGRSLPALRGLDTGGDVIHLGTFSKLLAPGLRLGYLAVDGPVLARFVEHKRATDLSTSPLLQRAVDRYVTMGRYRTHLRRTVRLGRQRRDALVEALARHLPDATFVRPAGGLFLWLHLGLEPDADELAEACARRGVEVADGRRFTLDPATALGRVRLNFAVLEPDEIDEGVRRLARAVADVAGGVGRPRTRQTPAHSSRAKQPSR